MSKSVLVIGAGITGVSTAEWLRRAGADVTLIDRVEPGASEQASFGNAGILARCAVVPVAEPSLLRKVPFMLFDNDAPLFMRWRYLPKLFPWLVAFLRNANAVKTRKIAAAAAALTDDSVDQHMALVGGTPAEEFLKKGDYSHYFPSRKDWLKAEFSREVTRQMGFCPVEKDREQLLKSDPNVSERYRFAVTYRDHGWLTSPGGYVAALAEHFVAAGGRFIRGEVTDISKDTVTLADGTTFCPDKIVLAAGAWSANLSGKLGHRARLESERGYHLFLKGVNFMPDTPFMVTDAKFVVTPMDEGLRCAGIVEFGGLKAPASKAPADLLRRRIRQVYPTLTWQEESHWMGHRPTTPDSLPHLGPLRSAPNVICAFGSQHIGITIGPRLGRMAADLALGKRINADISPYDPDRFA